MPAEQSQAQYVLVVDDDAMMRRFLQEYLGDLGLSVVVAENGRQAIDIFHRLRSSIHLLITDLRMPEMDGVSLIRCIRQLDEHLPIVAITGYADDEMLQAIRPHVTLLIRKPMGSSELDTLAGLMGTADPGA